MRSRRLIAALFAPLLVIASLALPATPSQAADASPTRRVEYYRTGAVNTQETIDQAMSSPALGDVTGDGVPDVVSGSMDGVLIVLDPRNGAVLRSITVQSGAMIQAAPSLVDVTGDGVLDVLVATVHNVRGTSRVKIFDLARGQSRVVFDRADTGIGNLSGFFGAPTAGDIDGDGAPEVVAIGLDHHLHAWELDGSVVAGFPVYTYDTALSSPALADIDGNGTKEIVVGGDMDHNQPYAAGGYLWVVGGRGDVRPGYPLRLGGEVIWSSPAVGDIDGDGDLDAVVGTGRNFGHADQRRLYAIDLRRAQAVAGWPQTLSANTMGSPALANLDGDAALEIVTTTGDGRLHRLEGGGQQTWNRCLSPAWQGCGADYAFIGSPVLADVDGDGHVEAVAAVNRELLVVDAVTGAEEHRETIRSNPGDYTFPAGNAPAVGRVGSDTYIATYLQVDDGDDVRADGDRQAIFTWSLPGAPGALPWSHFQRDVRRTGSIEMSAAEPAELAQYVDAAHRDLLRRPATAQEQSYWSQRMLGGLPRYEFALALSRSPEWTGLVIDALYRQVFDREPDSGGRAYWSDLVSRGMRVAAVAAQFYGSDEWFHRDPPTGGGGTLGGFVDNLYRRVLQREPDAAREYWLDQLRRGVSRVTVASAFYLSYESNARRVDALYQLLLDRPSEPAGRDHWSRMLVEMDDIALAAQLVASEEYFLRNT